VPDKAASESSDATPDEESCDAPIAAELTTGEESIVGRLTIDTPSGIEVTISVRPRE
jgi:hypothetical protein